MAKKKFDCLLHGPMKWFSGFLLSVLFIWVVSIFFVNTIEPYDFNPILKRYVVSKGNVNRERSEGWGDSEAGALGIYGIEDITKVPQRKVAVWGDSFVNAVQVDDNEKMAQVFTELCRKNGLKSLMGFGIGYQGGAIGDYYFDIPNYEKIVPSIVAHVILISDLKDILPDQPVQGSLFKSFPDFHFVERKMKPILPNNLRKIVRGMEMNFLFDLALAVKTMKKLRFAPGTASEKGNANEERNVNEKGKNEISNEKALQFLVKKMKRQTKLPVIMLYCPRIPRLKNGSFDFSDPLEEVVRQLSIICRSEGISFIDMTGAFIEYHEKTGLLHRGFSNSMPGKGHFNPAGHRLVAEALFEYFKTEFRLPETTHK